MLLSLVTRDYAYRDWKKFGSSRTRKVPAVLVVGTQYVAMAFVRERWENRLVKDSICYSDSKRSMCVKLRLGHARAMWIIGTYIHHSPERHKTQTQAEWDWIQTQTSLGRLDNAIVLVGGDFNTYPDEGLDRRGVGVGERSSQAKEMSHRFETWTTTHGLVSSFKSHHRTTPRFTYERGGVKTALDDIYVSGEHESIIVSSGIWLHSLVSSDHVGTPFVVLRCERGTRIAATVHEITHIKVVSTRDKTSEEMTAFTIVTDKMLGEGKITLIEDIDPATTNEAEILDWLERAIVNMNECLYTSAKNLWGESNQSRRQLARSVSVKRSNRCTAQLRQIQQLTELPEVCANDLINATNAVHWPKWVVRPDLMVEGSAHEHGTRNLVMLLACPPHERATEAWVAWVRTIIKQWRQIMRTRRNWRQTQRQIRIQEQRQTWFSGGGLKRFLRSTLGNQAPPVTIRSALVSESTGFRYTESRSEVQAELTKLLDNWIPADENRITTFLGNVSS
ncbi:hypothetical protein PHMEG_00027465 [Phytophthora megakarya]|uniref:Endonuclease/exonuclease/phosphatase domain-containing protein n=1 Tax=Phytophthora megakarya TaxID=4795 RepID=A0A225V6V2_9STRA|nr:hypothetical protein PHMEG_00027465 [Phytophthora megakarya]